MLKEEVLSMLLNAREPVSGEGICRTLGVTRAAVWKTIDQLRQEGYAIDAAPKRGYTLSSVPDRLDTALVRAYLSGHPWQTLTAAVPSVDSTNNACKRLAAEGAPDGTVVLTDCQTAGRGRRGRTFVSPPGGLYFSAILRPHAKPEALMHLTAMVAVAAARAVFAVSGVYPDIKWTNDLVLGGKKLCGILTEIGIEAESREVDYAVVGIGINCARVDLPPEVSAMSASLEAFTGRKPDRARLARCLSAMKDDRVEASKAYARKIPAFTGDKAKFVEAIRQALYASKIVSYAQGYTLMRTAAKTYGWNLNYGGIALMWRGGCIIRSVFLGKIKEAYDKNPELSNLLLDPYFKDTIGKLIPAWREVASAALAYGIPAPTMTSALSYFDGYTTERLPANLLQAQRDYFGAHTYERLDAPRGKFFHTNWTGHGGNTSAATYNA